MCVGGGTGHRYRAEDNFMELLISFMWFRLRPLGLCGKYLYLLSHLDPEHLFFITVLGNFNVFTKRIFLKEDSDGFRNILFGAKEKLSFTGCNYGQSQL